MRVGADGFDGDAGMPEALTGDLLDEREHVVALQRVCDDRLADVVCQIGHVQAERKVAEVAQPFDEYHGLAGSELELAGHRRRRRHRHRGPDLVADLAVALEGLLQPDERVQAVVVLADGHASADLGLAVDEPLGLEHRQRLADGVA